MQCFECKDIGNARDETMLKCLHKTCKKFYHQHCTTSWSKVPEFITKRKCPRHTCNACGSRRDSGPIKLFRCLECPVAYHENCCPDGSRLCEDMPGYMVCPKHDNWRCHTQVQNTSCCLSDFSTNCLFLISHLSSEDAWVLHEYCHCSHLKCKWCSLYW